MSGIPKTGVHYGMQFRVLTGTFAGEVGTIAATDFEYGTTDLVIGPNMLTFLNREIELHGHENCDAPVCKPR